MPFCNVLNSMWLVKSKSEKILDKCTTMNQLLDQLSCERSKILRSSITVSFIFLFNSIYNVYCILKGVVQEKRAQVAPNHLPLATPAPPVWSPSPVGGSYISPAGQPWADPSMIDNLKRQVDLLRSQLAGASEENSKLKKEVSSLKVLVEKGTSQQSEAEATLVPSQVSGSQSTQMSRFVTFHRIINPIIIDIITEKMSRSSWTVLVINFISFVFWQKKLSKYCIL